MRVPLLILTLLAPNSLMGGPSSYICEITDFNIPGGDVENREWVGEAAMETTVAIDRKTGRVIHPTIGNASFTNVTVLNEGSPSWGFKVLADSGNGGHIRYYEVHEHDVGATKAFLAVSDGIAFIGRCL
ncbi:hypothetical protein [Sulfitobacter sp. 1A16808]|uniref:hypothetical protein n=1 Tax=Sulfitobacter sp. 1A16808 TaxID=3368572 RepID=UPI003746DEA8